LPHGWVGNVIACPLTLAPVRRSIEHTDLGDDAKQALRAAAGSGLKLRL